MTNVTNMNFEDRMRVEAIEWREMPFVELDDDKIVRSWAPAKIMGGADGKEYCDQCTLGAAYALRFLEHIRDFAEFDTSDYLVEIVKDIAERGEWGGVEIGFFCELGRHMSDGLSQIPSFKAEVAS